MNKEKICGKFDTSEFKAEEMCCVCGGGFTGGRLSLSAKYFGKDSIAGKYIPQDISYTGYAAIAVLALPTFLFLTLSSPFLLIAQMLGVDFMKGYDKIIAESFKNEILPLSVALFMVLLVSCVIIKIRYSRKGRDDFQVA